MKIPIFPGKYHQNGGFSMAMLVSGRYGNFRISVWGQRPIFRGKRYVFLGGVMLSRPLNPPHFIRGEPAVAERTVQKYPANFSTLPKTNSSQLKKWNVGVMSIIFFGVQPSTLWFSYVKFQNFGNSYQINPEMPQETLDYSQIMGHGTCMRESCVSDPPGKSLT